jgi:hypothetical protein
MPHVLPVPALELRQPVPFLVLVKADDPAKWHQLTTPHVHKRAGSEACLFYHRATRFRSTLRHHGSRCVSMI